MIDYGYGVVLDTLDRATKAREWRNDSSIYQNCRQVGLISRWDQGLWMEKGDTKHMFSVMRPYYPFIEKTGTPDLVKSSVPERWDAIGVAGLTSAHLFHRTAEISLYVAPEYQKDVGARPIIKTVAAYAFEDLGLNRIFGETFATNIAELANLKECGFVHEGTLRQTYYKQGRFIDSVIQSMLRADYEKEKEKWKAQSTSQSS